MVLVNGIPVAEAQVREPTGIKSPSTEAPVQIEEPEQVMEPIVGAEIGLSHQRPKHGQGEAQYDEIAPVKPRGSHESAHGARISVRCGGGLFSLLVLFLDLERLGGL